jgi:hypothetical protein
MGSCSGQTTSKKEFYNKDFNWRISIPADFQIVSEEEWAKIQNKGAEAIEKTFDEKVINQAKTIFVFKSDQLNFFESNYQPFDIAVDGNYLESCKNVHNMIYETFITQMPDLKIDSISSIEKIDNIGFQTFTMKVEYPNKMILHVLMYSRLFGKRAFSVNIMYVDKNKGQQMLESWRKSKFTD